MAVYSSYFTLLVVIVIVIVIVIVSCNSNCNSTCNSTCNSNCNSNSDNTFIIITLQQITVTLTKQVRVSLIVFLPPPHPPLDVALHIQGDGRV